MAGISDVHKKPSSYMKCTFGSSLPKLSTINHGLAEAKGDPCCVKCINLICNQQNAITWKTGGVLCAFSHSLIDNRATEGRESPTIYDTTEDFAIY